MSLQTSKAVSIITASGSALKSMNNTGLVSGHLILFGDPARTDIDDQYFDGTTDFDTTLPGTIRAFYGHGRDPIIGKRRFNQKEAEIGQDELGIWWTHQLNLATRYEALVNELVIQGKMGLSSGTAAHLLQVSPVKGMKAEHISYWPLAEGSYTPTPAEPGTRSMLKALKDIDLPNLEELAGVKPQYRGITLPSRPAKDMQTVDTPTYGGGTYSYPQTTIGNVIRAALDDAITDVITAALSNGVLTDAQYKAMRDNGDAYVDGVLETLTGIADNPAPYGLIDALSDEDDEDDWFKSIDVDAAIKAGRKMSAANHAEMGDHLAAIDAHTKSLKRLHKDLSPKQKESSADDANSKGAETKDIDPDAFAFAAEIMATNLRVSTALNRS